MLKNIVESTNRYSAHDRDILRRFIGPAQELEIDKQGRILIPSHLRDFAGLSKDCLIVGLYDYIEIWEPSRYKTYQLSDDEMKNRTEEFSNKMKGSIEE
jgi:MraZ protein